MPAWAAAKTFRGEWKLFNNYNKMLVKKMDILSD
jgi:hypothetical protein